jgi:hypothetical protein
VGSSLSQVRPSNPVTGAWGGVYYRGASLIRNKPSLLSRTGAGVCTGVPRPSENAHPPLDLPRILRIGLR